MYDDYPGGSARISECLGTTPEAAVEDANLEMEHDYPDQRNARAASILAQTLKLLKVVDT